MGPLHFLPIGTETSNVIAADGSGAGSTLAERGGLGSADTQRRLSPRLRLIGPRGTLTELVETVLIFGGFTVDPADIASGAADPEALVLVSPGPAEWQAAAGFSGGVLLVTDRRPSDADVVEATLTGADAVVNLDISPEELLRAVDAVRAGGTLLSPSQARLLARAARSAAAARPVPTLTPRERAILDSAERGESVKQTARALGIAPKTVENLQSRLFRKLGACNRAHAVVLAHRFGLLSATQ
jgi:DNA-binding CsgD family transcriptional regulator